MVQKRIDRTNAGIGRKLVNRAGVIRELRLAFRCWIRAETFSISSPPVRCSHTKGPSGRSAEAMPSRSVPRSGCSRPSAILRCRRRSSPAAPCKVCRPRNRDIPNGDMTNGSSSRCERFSRSYCYGPSLGQLVCRGKRQSCQSPAASSIAAATMRSKLCLARVTLWRARKKPCTRPGSFVQRALPPACLIALR